MTKRLYSRMEACDFLRIGPTKIWMLEKDGELRPVRVGSRVLFREEDLQRFIEQQVRKGRRRGVGV